jgi:hypothetical protein
MFKGREREDTERIPDSEYQGRNRRASRILERKRSLSGHGKHSTLWMKLYDALEDEGIPVVLANPYKTRVIAESKLKNDKVDAAILADLLRADMVASSYVPEKEVRELKELIISKTDPCEDPAFTFFTFLGSDAPEEVMVRPLKEQLLLDREVLVRGVPCPHKELGKTIEAYWLAFTPREKIVLCQIRITEGGERIPEVIEEGWDGTQLFHEEKPLPICRSTVTTMIL